MNIPRRSLTLLWAVCFGIVFALFAPRAAAADLRPPGQMAFQGFLTDGSGNPRGQASPVNLNVVFRIYDSPNAAATAAVWAESQVVTVDKGHFSIVLGEGTTVPGLPSATDLASLFSGDTSTGRYIGLTVENETEISPRIQFLSAPFAHLSRYATELVGPSSGANLTSLNASQLTSGTILDARLGPNVARRDVGNILNGHQEIRAGNITLDNQAIILGKNSAGVAEQFLHPRWSDDASYLTYGANGFVQRNRTFQTTMFMSANNRVVIGNSTAPEAKLHIIEAAGTAHNVNSGSIIIDHQDNGGASSITFRSAVNRGNDHAWIQYQDASVLGGGGEASVLSIGTFNDADDHIALMPAGNVGIGVMNPKNMKMDMVGGGTYGSSYLANPFNEHDAANRGNLIHFAHIGQEFAGMYVQLTDGKSPNGICGNSADIVFNTWECNTSSSREVFRINGGGRVGINNAFPQARLHVSGWVGQNRTFVYYARNGNNTANIGGSSGIVDYGIIADNRIGASEFNAFSDARIKNILGRSDTAQDLNTLLNIEITDYRHKDMAQMGEAVHKKVIAQQIEKVFPQAVSQHTGLVPDIYQVAPLTNGWVYLKTDVKVGDRLRLIELATENETNGVFEVLEVDKENLKFRTDFKPKSNEVFVYGREVKDFRSVDYNAIAMLNVSATQQLKKEKDAEVKALQDENATLKSLIDALDARDKQRAVEVGQATSKMETMERELTQLKKLVADLAAGREAAPKKVAAAGEIGNQAAR